MAARLRSGGSGAAGPLFGVVAPLRVCPLGAHVDHQGGVVTGLTVDRSVDLLALSCRLMSRGTVPSAVRAALGPGCRTIDPVVIEGGAAVGSSCTIGPEVYLEAGSSIGDRAVIRRSIVLEGGRVGDGETIVDAVVAD